MINKKIIVICGPTATGKSALAVRIAKKINGEILSADSMQIFTSMNIGTAKISPIQMDGVVHHMINVISPREKFSAAEYKERAELIIEDIAKRGCTPIICGGTGLYINSIIYKYDFSKAPENTALREELNEVLRIEGKEKLYKLLKDICPDTSISQNDVKRIIRAIEISRQPKQQGTCVKISDQNLIENYRIIGLNDDREILYKRINERVDNMFETGLLNEVDYLLNIEKLNFDTQSMQAIGYKEFKRYYSGELSIEEVKEEIKKNSRNYAKRQITWFKKLPGIEWFNDLDLALRSIN